MNELDANRERACRFVLQMPSGTIDPALHTPDFDCWNSAMGGLISGAAYLEGIAGVARVAPGMHMQIDGTVAEGNDVAVRASSTVTLPNGVVYANAYHFLFSFDGHRIRRVHAYMNTKLAEEALIPLVWGERRNFQDARPVYEHLKHINDKGPSDDEQKE